MANRLKELRVRKGFTQEFMAEKLGMPRQSSYASWERGTADKQAHRFIQLSKILECTITQLFPLPEEEVGSVL